MDRRTIIHVDMDAFYASIEERDDPALQGQAVIVGGPSKRGVVSAANYRARSFGVHSAMPIAQALRRCPQATLVKPRMSVYAQVSRQIHAIFGRVTPQIEPLALDEAFLDVSASLKLFGNAETIGRLLKQSIRNELGLVASVGIGPNKLIAKIASDVDKPDGFVVVPDDRVQSFLDPLPVERLWGIGPKSLAQLHRMGIRTIAQLRGASVELLDQCFGQSGGHWWRLAQGLDDRPVVTDRDAKSISQETTFEEDLSDPEILHQILSRLSETVGYRLRASGSHAKTIFVKVRLAGFAAHSRQVTLETSTQATQVIYRQARILLDQLLGQHQKALRLIGVGVSGLGSESAQMGLFDAGSPAPRIDQISDRINSRFGRGVLTLGRSLKPKSPKDSG